MSFYSKLKRLLVGKPIHTKHAHHERLAWYFALPVFASDALSSVAYATEEIMRQLLTTGTVHFALTLPIALAIGVLLVIVASSYYQTINNYPQGGGSYRVATENLGSVAGRVAGASLLIDYVLTVAVSISAGVLAIVSLAPATQPYIIEMGVGAIAVVGLMNLRGARESGAVFAVPTYSFIVLILAVIVSAALKIGSGYVPPPLPAIAEVKQLSQFGLILLVLHAFSSGCTALTGVEAIADGVQAFKAPEAKNASKTLVVMAATLLTMFLGISWIAQHLNIVPMPEGAENFKTVTAQIAATVFGEGWIFGALQVATALILILAANTAFADFPRLSSFIARDNFLPRQLASQGDRLVFQNGIITLSLLAIILIVVFKGNTHALIPLYAVGVFTSFTLSQAGMFVKLRKLKKTVPMFISGFGCLTTFVVTGVILESKFAEGAWIIVVALAIIMTVFWGIRRHYTYLAGELSLSADDKLVPVKTTVLLLVPRVHRGILRAIAYAQSMTKDVRALHVTIDPSTVHTVKEDWARFGADIPLVILASPYRSLIEPIIEYIDEAIAEEPGIMVTVIVPQAVPKRWWQGLLHNNAALGLKIALAGRKNVVITNVRYFLK